MLISGGGKGPGINYGEGRYTESGGGGVKFQLPLQKRWGMETVLAKMMGAHKTF